MPRLVEQDEILLTFTLGDSLNDINSWYRLPILAEDFPYIAAPFILQARQRLQDETAWYSLRYRNSAGNLDAIYPIFKNNLESKLKINIIENPNPDQENISGTVFGYVETQIWGPLYVSDAFGLSTESNKRPQNRLLEILSMLEVRHSSYKSSY